MNNNELNSRSDNYLNEGKNGIFYQKRPSRASKSRGAQNKTPNI